MNGLKELIKLLDNNVSVNGGLAVNPIAGHKLLDTVIYTYKSLARESDIDISTNVTGIQSVAADISIIDSDIPLQFQGLHCLIDCFRYL